MGKSLRPNSIIAKPSDLQLCFCDGHQCMASSRDHCEHKCRSKVCDAKENMIQKRCHLLWTKAHWKSGKPSNSKLFIQFNKMFHCFNFFCSWVVLNKFKDSNNEVSACDVSVSQKLRHQSSLNMWLSVGFLLFDWSIACCLNLLFVTPAW